MISPAARMGRCRDRAFASVMKNRDPGAHSLHRVTVAAAPESDPRWTVHARRAAQPRTRRLFHRDGCPVRASAPASPGESPRSRRPPGSVMSLRNGGSRASPGSDTCPHHLRPAGCRNRSIGARGPAGPLTTRPMLHRAAGRAPPAAWVVTDAGIGRLQRHGSWTHIAVRCISVPSGMDGSSRNLRSRPGVARRPPRSRRRSRPWSATTTVALRRQPAAH